MASHTNDRREAVMHTGYPGHVFDFDPVTQTCTVQLAINTLYTGMKDAYSFVRKQRLRNVPVQFIQGGGWFFTHPVPDGTPCWVHFAMRGITHWVADNKDTPDEVMGKPGPEYGRMFSHNDAVCVLGTQPIPKAIPAFQNAGMEMRNADRSMRVRLVDTSIEIVAGSSVIRVAKNGDIRIETTTKATVKAPAITLDGAVTVTKSLTVQGGMAVSGTTGGQTMSITGNVKYTGSVDQTGTFTLNGIAVNTHKHANPEGGDVGPMKA